MNRYFSFLSVVSSIICLAACTTSSVRVPAQTQYEFSDQFSCAPKTKSSKEDRDKWSPLTGFKVGATSYTNWQLLNKKTLRPFTSDGCSMSPNGMPGSEQNEKWTECCVNHDMAYWLGGTLEDKEKSDSELQQCIAEKGFPETGKIYKLFVGKFGGPDSSQTYRWGYGWSYKRPYAPITSQEESMIVEEFGINSSQVMQSLRGNVVRLTNVCDSHDHGLKNLSADEEKIYKILSESVKNEDVIEWAKEGYFNLERKEYVVKLQSCQQPVTFVFVKNKQESPRVRSECENL